MTTHRPRPDRFDPHDFRQSTTTKGVRVNAEQRVKTQSPRTGVFAKLRDLVRGNGSGASARSLNATPGFSSRQQESPLDVFLSHAEKDGDFAAVTTRVMREDAAARPASPASGGPSEARTQGGRPAALSAPGCESDDAGSPIMTGERRKRDRLSRPRTKHRAMSAAVSVVVVLGTAASLAAAPAQAATATPWWHLDTSVRPAILHGGSASNEVQQLTVSATGGSFVFVCGEFGAFCANEGHEVSTFPVFNVTAAQLQTELGPLFGAGNVEVSGGPTATGTGTVFGAVSTTGTTTAGSSTVQAISFAPGAVGGFVIGQTIEGAGIPAGTTITAMSGPFTEENPGELTLSANATASGSGVALTGVASKTVTEVTTATGTFSVGQELSARGLAEGTTIEAVGSGTLTLSQAPTEPGEAGARLGVLAPYRITYLGQLSGRPVPLPLIAGFNLTGARREGTITELSSARPDGVLVVRGSNLGNAPATAPTTLTASLPPGIGIGRVSFFGFDNSSGQTNLAGPGVCTKTADTATCSTKQLEEEETEPFSGKFKLIPLRPYEYVEMRVGLIDTGATAGAEFEAEVSGGGATAVARRRTLPIGSGAPAFGAEEYNLVPEEEGGQIDARAASHPYQLTTTFALNQNGPESEGAGEAYVRPPALARNLHFRLPPGQIGNATAVPQCTEADFEHSVANGANLCPADTAIGAASITVDEPLGLHLATYPVPLFNLQPAYGEPVRFGFELAHTPVVLDTAVRSGPGEDYGVTVTTANTSQLVNFLAATVTFWGTPGDQTHDASRGWECLAGGQFTADGGTSCEPQKQQKPLAFLTLPTNCAAPFATTVEGDSWTSPSTPERKFLDPFTYSLEEAGAPKSLIACNQVPFDPQVHSEPTSNSATSPTGLNFDINFEDEGLLNPGGLAQSQLKKAVVTLPQGFTANPSVAEGLKACSEGEYEAATVEPATGCNQESKVGDVEVTSPLVKPDQVLTGGLYVAKQGENPSRDAEHPKGNLLTLYLIARNPEIGVVVKQALKVIPNPVTGQLTTEVDDVPQLPFSHFHLSFRQGQRSPLITPPACGPYTVRALLSPWSNPEAAVERTSSFQITSGPEGQGCPSGGVPPFHPGLEAGTLNNSAGTYSPFVTHITRKDSEQEITRFSIKLPTGLLAKLKGVSECSDAQVAAAKAREHEGGATEEEAHPSCPSGSEVGTSKVGTGVGNVLAYAGGKLYLAGPYHGSPISLVSVTGAKVGPFDLGTVVVRFALDVNHETAEVSVDGANSDPIPHIVDGIPVHLRDIRAYVNRPGFTLNPTSCAKKSTAATILGSGANFASSADDVPVTVSSPFQAADCASLGFKPQLALSLTGKKTHRGALPAFKAVLTYPKKGAYANIAKAQVTLPGSEFLEQGHLKNVCTRKVFETGKNPGENCPKNSIYGKARATTPLLDAPLEGPVYLRTGYGTKLPELAAALNGPQISITLAGKIDSVHQKGTEGSRIRNTFAVVPDAPVEKFVLELKGGKKGLLVNSTDVCKGTHKALAAFTGQNGKLDEYEPALKAQCGKGKKKSGSKKSGGAKKKGGH
jgi:hypothetical protein